MALVTQSKINFALLRLPKLYVLKSHDSHDNNMKQSLKDLNFYIQIIFFIDYLSCKPIL